MTTCNLRLNVTNLRRLLSLITIFIGAALTSDSRANLRPETWQAHRYNEQVVLQPGYYAIVRYGNGVSWTYKLVENTFTCNAANFANFQPWAGPTTMWCEKRYTLFTASVAKLNETFLNTVPRSYNIKWKRSPSSGSSVGFRLREPGKFRCHPSSVGLNWVAEHPTMECVVMNYSPVWTPVASSGQSFHLQEPATVRFGSGSAWRRLFIKPGLVTCSAAVFSHPNPGADAQCQILNRLAVPDPSSPH